MQQIVEICVIMNIRIPLLNSIASFVEQKSLSSPN